MLTLKKKKVALHFVISSLLFFIFLLLFVLFEMIYEIGFSFQIHSPSNFFYLLDLVPIFLMIFVFI
jgi:hypothetical protein